MVPCNENSLMKAAAISRREVLSRGQRASKPLTRTLLAALALAATTAYASDEHPIDAELTRCMESPEGMSTQGMRSCMGSATQAWDGELNRVWKALMSELTPMPKEQLRAAQRKWIAFRDAELEALASAYGAMSGTLYSVMHADAVSALTRDRVRQLDALLEAQRGSVQ